MYTNLICATGQMYNVHTEETINTHSKGRQLLRSFSHQHRPHRTITHATLETKEKEASLRDIRVESRNYLRCSLAVPGRVCPRVSYRLVWTSVKPVSLFTWVPLFFDAHCALTRLTHVTRDEEIIVDANMNSIHLRNIILYIYIYILWDPWYNSESLELCSRFNTISLFTPDMYRRSISLWRGPHISDQGWESKVCGWWQRRGH